MKFRHGMDKTVAIVTACCLLFAPLAPVLAAAQQTQAPATTTAAPVNPGIVTLPPAASASDVDGGWPRLYPAASGASIILYQPQISSWDNQTEMTLYAAVAYTPKNGKRTLGTIKASTDTKVSTTERLVSYSSLKITDANFPDLDKNKVQEITMEIGGTLKDGVIALDRVLSGLDKSQIIPKNVDGVKADPPEIFFSKKPALLVNLDGPPIWSPIMGTDLQYAINTNWDLFLHGPSKIYYLRDEQSWLRTSTLEGGWVPATLPDSFKKLPKDDNWKEVIAAVPGKKVSEDKAPQVFLTEKPAEMILLKGEPKYEKVDDTTNLYWVSNTESDVFREGKTGSVYYLVTGRWFRAPDFTGPWAFASLDMPEDFKKISLEHERSRVLASVPGTTQAAEAVLLAQVPETARIDKKTVKAPQVVYQGEPKFEPIEKTSLQYAANTDKQIIKFGDLYYMCFQAVWFMSKSPNGPWEVTGEIPKEIYNIPTESPVHNVTYVTVVEDDDDDDDAVIFAAAAAYTGVMIAWGCAVWGTGWYYPPYVGYGGFYPVYYPRYPTYGYGAWYNPWTGGYGRGMVAYGPYGGAGVTARYNPATGTYSRAAAAYGPYGSRAAGSAYNPRTGTYAATRQGSNVYGSWGTTGVTRGDSWATTSRVTNNVTGNTTRVTQGSGGGTAISRTGPGGGGFVAQGGTGDVYAGRDGSVYRNSGEGGWQKYENGGWNNVATPEQRQQLQDRASQAGQNRPSQGQGAQASQLPNRPTNLGGIDQNTAGQLNRDRAVRTEGTQRTRDLSTVRSSPSPSRSTGTYRPSPSISRAGGGGGGRRR
jgi:hypothetical protein